MKQTIKTVFAREILDSRGNPTIEVEVSDGVLTGRAAVPSGASTGVHEALELRDGDASRYKGNGVLTAVKNVNDILASEVKGINPQEQELLDKVLIDFDGTPNKSKYGANAILGISLAACRLAALQKDVPLFRHINDLFGGEMKLPRPMMNVINGGKHADSGLAIQEFMIFPKLESFEKNLQAGSEIFHTLKKILAKRGETVGVGDEGGFAPRLGEIAKAFEVLEEAIQTAGYTTDQVEFAIDAAASEFYEDGKYLIDGKKLSGEELVDFYTDLLKKYPSLVSIEDSHSEDDFEGFAWMQKTFGEKIQLVGDDLLVTNKTRLQMGIDQKLCNSILIKVNQIGTLTETFETMHLAHANGFTTVVSHRSGETEDSFIADLAVGTGAGQIKTGSLSRSERVGKYNQLLRISEQL